MRGAQTRIADLDEQISPRKTDLTRLRNTVPTRHDPTLLDALPLGMCVTWDFPADD